MSVARRSSPRPWPASGSEPMRGHRCVLGCVRDVDVRPIPERRPAHWQHHAGTWIAVQVGVEDHACDLQVNDDLPGCTWKIASVAMAAS
jgi:hypothetical protein